MEGQAIVLECNQYLEGFVVRTGLGCNDRGERKGVQRKMDQTDVSLVNNHMQYRTQHKKIANHGIITTMPKRVNQEERSAPSLLVVIVICLIKPLSYWSKNGLLDGSAINSP